MLAAPVRQIGAAARRRIGAARRGIATNNAARELAKNLEEKPREGWTTNQLWLLSRITEFESRSSKELHELRWKGLELEMQLDDLNAKIRDHKAQRTVEMAEWAVRAIGVFGICAMHVIYMCT